MKHWEDDKILNDSKWHIVYGTVGNDAQLVNGSELYLCDMLNDTRRMNAMNFEWCKFEWCKFEWLYEYWNDIILNE